MFCLIFVDEMMVPDHFRSHFFNLRIIYIHIIVSKSNKNAKLDIIQNIYSAVTVLKLKIILDDNLRSSFETTKNHLILSFTIQ